MTCGTQAAAAVGAGYLLGRYHKRRLGTILVAVALTGDIGGMLRRRVTHLPGLTGVLSGLSPEEEQITDTIRADLLDARCAALDLLSSRLDSLADRLRDRAGTLPDLGAGGGQAAGQPGGGQGERPAGDEAETAALPEPPKEAGEKQARQENQQAGEEPRDVPEASALAGGGRREPSPEPGELEGSPARPRGRPARPAARLPGATVLLGGLSAGLREITGLARDEVLDATDAVRNLLPAGTAGPDRQERTPSADKTAGETGAENE